MAMPYLSLAHARIQHLSLCLARIPASLPCPPPATVAPSLLLSICFLQTATHASVAWPHQRCTDVHNTGNCTQRKFSVDCSYTCTMTAVIHKEAAHLSVAASSPFRLIRSFLSCSSSRRSCLTSPEARLQAVTPRCPSWWSCCSCCWLHDREIQSSYQHADWAT